jgi:hypothetical protein
MLYVKLVLLKIASKCDLAQLDFKVSCRKSALSPGRQFINLFCGKIPASRTIVNWKVMETDENSGLVKIPTLEQPLYLLESEAFGHRIEGAVQHGFGI